MSTLTTTDESWTFNPAIVTEEETGRRFRVQQDNYAECPRGSWWSNEEVALWSYEVPRLLGSVLGERTDSMEAMDVFEEVYDRTGDAEFAVKLVRRFLPILTGEDGWKVGLYEFRGYSQGDWGDWVIITSPEQEPERVGDNVAMWARGDVWQVTELGTDDEVGTIGGIYADNEQDAVREYMRGL